MKKAVKQMECYAAYRSKYRNQLRQFINNCRDAGHQDAKIRELISDFAKHNFYAKHYELNFYDICRDIKHIAPDLLKSSCTTCSSISARTARDDNAPTNYFCKKRNLKLGTTLNLKEHLLLPKNMHKELPGQPHNCPDYDLKF